MRTQHFSALQAAGVLTLACLGLGTTGCAQKDFSIDKAMSLVGSVHLDAEQVMLSGAEVDCGVKNDLWEAPAGADSAGRSSARLLEAGRNLHFDDDVVFSDAGLKQPYVQVRGDFPLQLSGDSSIRDEGSDGKIVEGGVSLMISNACFPNPLPLLGVRKGKFAEDQAPVLRFDRQDDMWHFTKIIH